MGGSEPPKAASFQGAEEEGFGALQFTHIGVTSPRKFCKLQDKKLQICSLFNVV